MDGIILQKLRQSVPMWDEWEQIPSDFTRQLWAVIEIPPKRKKQSDLLGSLLWSSGMCASGLRGKQ